MKPSADEWKILNRLGKQRRALPRLAEAGPLPTQRHAAIAAARAIHRHRAANVQGEMGVGKTTSALGVIELPNAYPSIILCPPNMVPKWIRQAEEVIPGARVRELHRIGRVDGEKVNDVQDFLDDYQAGRFGLEGDCGCRTNLSQDGRGMEASRSSQTQ